jgi:hypothetical protein
MIKMNNMNQMGTFVPQRNQFSSYFNPASAQSASTNNIVWVQGIEGAKAWQLNPNSMVILLDSEAEGKMYIKVSDNIGMCSLRIFDYTEVAQPSNVTVNKDLDLSNYVRKDELLGLLKEIMNEQPVSTVAPAANEQPSTIAASATKITYPTKK